MYKTIWEHDLRTSQDIPDNPGRNIGAENAWCHWGTLQTEG